MTYRRKFVDHSKRFELDAYAIGFVSNRVVLVKADTAAQVVVEVKKLSAEDQLWLRKKHRQDSKQRPESSSVSPKPTPLVQIEKLICLAIQARSESKCATRRDCSLGLVASSTSTNPKIQCRQFSSRRIKNRMEFIADRNSCLNSCTLHSNAAAISAKPFCLSRLTDCFWRRFSSPLLISRNCIEGSPGIFVVIVCGGIGSCNNPSGCVLVPL